MSSRWTDISLDRKMNSSYLVSLEQTLCNRKKPASFEGAAERGRGRLLRDVISTRRGSVGAGAQLRAGEHKQSRPAAVSGLLYLMFLSCS